MKYCQWMAHTTILLSDIRHWGQHTGVTVWDPALDVKAESRLQWFLLGCWALWDATELLFPSLSVYGEVGGRLRSSLSSVSEGQRDAEIAGLKVGWGKGESRRSKSREEREAALSPQIGDGG